VNIETLLKNQWLSLKKIVAPERGINGYYYSHEERCNGCIIAVLPWRRANDGHIEYMVKCEVTPCWSLSPVRSALTGGWEGGPPVEDAQRELEEESGYTVSIGQFIALGESYASKSADTRYRLYAVDLTGVVGKPHKGDGSVLEASATCDWLSEEELVTVEDPQVHVMLNRLKARLKK
jgi:ADP-ribose pyrophosphatase YjhB (NUDIX family)